MTELNYALFRMINDLGKQYTYLNPAFVFIAEYLIYALALSVAIYWFTNNRTHKMMVISGILAFILAEALGKVAGMLHYNEQPFVVLSDVNQLIDKAVNNSFPSDHTMLFFSFCTVFWLYKRSWGWIWMVIAILVGISRIWVGVHYPADVAVGIFISIFTAVATYWMVPKSRLIQQFIAMYEKVEQKVIHARSSN
ncbi:undecaprenyl-diphosphatase [Paenibacillus selenitireducens]|uniref:Undecaprenyl-diphosphatase n=1 Tax=Paenibacillus selenitireducens TaxID=1324314 RepID=A0A1T2X6L1_9BACL|nr:undecaprenyl-diphosphatase [Paenibacillus selenitireducens]OPA75233.1 undecaprenyl-diphosphatase [Paenibacillus selenitireducens]